MSHMSHNDIRRPVWDSSCKRSHIWTLDPGMSFLIIHWGKKKKTTTNIRRQDFKSSENDTSEQYSRSRARAQPIKVVQCGVNARRVDKSGSLNPFPDKKTKKSSLGVPVRFHTKGRRANRTSCSYMLNVASPHRLT